MNEDLGLLRAMLMDTLSAPAIFRPTNFWASSAVSIIIDLANSGVSTFRRHNSARSFYVPRYKDGPEGEAQALADYRIFLEADDDRHPPHLKQVSESPLGEPSQHFCFDGRHYSRSFLNYLRGLVFLKKMAETRSVRTVLEIGGGYGTLGEILMKSDADRHFYVDIDVPPLAYVATRYLEELLGPENVAAYDRTKDWDTIEISALADTYQAAVLCPWQLPRIRGTFDLFVNFISFQEMEPEVVENYARYVNRHVGKYLLLRNQRHGKKLARKPGEVGVFSPVTREHYLKYFSPFELAGIDSQKFGHARNGFASEVMVLKRGA